VRAKKFLTNIERCDRIEKLFSEKTSEKLLKKVLDKHNEM